MEGVCGCGAVTYRLTKKPMFVHCCHCSECQKQTGSAYVLNAIIEADRVEVTGETADHLLPTPSGNGQRITRCKACGVALFSAYLIREGKLCYVRVGTLKDPSQCPPDVQIFTSSKQPWVPLNPDIPIFEEFYSFKEVWPPEAFARLKAAIQ
jgi:hypothetical protein